MRRSEKMSWRRRVRIIHPSSKSSIRWVDLAHSTAAFTLASSQAESRAIALQTALSHSINKGVTITAIACTAPCLLRHAL